MVLFFSVVATKPCPECTVDCCSTQNLPEQVRNCTGTLFTHQVHLSYIDDPHTSMGVTWVTQRQVNSIVEYTVGGKTLNGKSQSIMYQYN